MSAQPEDHQSGLEQVMERFNNLPQEMVTDYLLIDAETATVMEQRNTHNRPTNPAKVKQHVETMLRGRWVQNGDPIRFSRTGVLLDGAHKLKAIIQADAAHWYNVVWGLADESQDVMDTGSKRSLSHALSLKGENNPNALGGAVRVIWQIDNGGTPGKWITEPTYAEFYEYIEAHPDIRESVQVASKVARALKVPASPVAAAHYYCAMVDQADADDFYTNLGDHSASLAEDSPVIALRSTATNWASRGSVSRMEQASLYDVCIRAFIAFRAGKTSSSAYRLNLRPRAYRQPS